MRRMRDREDGGGGFAKRNLVAKGERILEMEMREEV
jgi:hypothetical protein